MPQLRAVLDKGFTLLNVIIVLVVIGVLATLVLVKMGGVKKEAYVAAMKNDLRNYATAEEQYFHAASDGYGSPDQVAARQGFAYSEDVRPDTASHSRNHWYLRVEHADTDIKCELYFSPAKEDPDAPNRIICPGDPLLMPVDVDLATSGIQFTLNTDDASYSAKIRQADGAVLDFEVLVRHPNDSTSLLCRRSGPREVLCSGDIPVEQEGEYTVTALGSIGGASPSEPGAQSARDSISYEVINLPPSASFSFSPNGPRTNETVAFDGAGSSDGDGTITSYSWDFGDGGTATGPTPSHSYGQDGEYSVRLTVTDNLGKQDTTMQTVGVANRAPTASLTFSPTEPQTSETIRLDGSTSEDPDGTVPDYRWSFDGETATAWGTVTTETSFGTDGDHTLALQVRDDDGTLSDWVEDTVTVTNRAPAASFTFSPSSPTTGETVSFDGTASSDPDGTFSSYSWDLDGDGAEDAKIATPSRSYADDGDYVVTLTVTDDDGDTGSTSQTVTVSNQSPAISSLACDDPKLTGETINCTAQGSDPDGSIVNWDWQDDYDGHRDTNTSTESQASRSFSDDGTYTASVVATDDDGGTAGASVSVTVDNREPSISSLSCNDPKETGQTVTCTAGGSDADGTIANYNWGNAFNSMKTTGSATPSEAARSFADDGTYTAAVQAKDDDGVWGPWETVSVTVTNQAPTASLTFSPTSPETDETISLNGSGSSDVDGSVTDYRWRFDGGTASAWSTSATTSTSFSSDGNHSLELQVRDDDGAVSGWTSQTVSVQNQPPTADFTFSPSDPTAGESVTFDGGPSLDPDGSVQRWTWNFGDGSSASGELVSHVFDTPGPHDVRLVVVDDDNESAADTTAVAVSGTYACTATPSDSVYNSTSQSGRDEMTITADASDPSDLHFKVETVKYQFGIENTWDGTCSGHKGGIRSNSLAVSSGAAGWSRTWGDAHEEQSFEWTSEGCTWKPSSAAQIGTLGAASGSGSPSSLEFWAYAGNNDRSVVRVDVPEPTGSSWSRTFDINSSGANDQNGSVTFSCSLQ